MLLDSAVTRQIIHPGSKAIPELFGLFSNFLKEYIYLIFVAFIATKIDPGTEGVPAHPFCDLSHWGWVQGRGLPSLALDPS
jgi:hypothetical protein